MRLFHTPERSFWCCTGTGIENHAKYADSIYFRGSDALWINLFIPSTVTWKDKGLTLQQLTTFPESPSTHFTVKVEQTVRTTLQLRRPGWCRAMSVRVNGRRWPGVAGANGYVAITREWRDGDLVDVDLPMTLRVEPLPGSADVVAFMYGPIVLAGRLGREGLTRGSQIIVNERESGTMLNAQRRGAGTRRRCVNAHEADPAGRSRPADVPIVRHWTAERRRAGPVLSSRARTVQRVLEARACVKCGPHSHLVGSGSFVSSWGRGHSLRHPTYPGHESLSYK